MSSDSITPISVTVSGGFIGGLLLGYALRKAVKIIAVIFGLFIAGLAYLQYHQMASFDWSRIEVLASSALGNVSAYLSNSHDASALAMSNFWYSIERKYVSGVCNRIHEGLMKNGYRQCS